MEERGSVRVHLMHCEKDSAGHGRGLRPKQGEPRSWERPGGEATLGPQGKPPRPLCDFRQ